MKQKEHISDWAVDQAEIERLKGEIADWRTDRDQLRQAVEERNQTIRLQEAEIKRINDEIKQLQFERDAAIGQANAARLNKKELQAEIERLKAEVDAALAYGYEYHKNPSMRGSSLHACRLAWKEWMVLAHENN